MSSKGYETGAHVVYKLSVHLVFVTKYRRKAITARVAEVGKMKRGGAAALWLKKAVEEELARRGQQP